MSGRCMEGVWKLSGRCLEGVWNPTYPIHINLTIFVVFLLRPNSIVIFRYQSPLRFGTLYFLKKRTSKMGWGSAVLSFLTFEQFSSVLNFLWKWASKFLLLQFCQTPTRLGTQSERTWTSWVWRTLFSSVWGVSGR